MSKVRASERPGYAVGGYRHALSIVKACKRDPEAIANAIVDWEAYRDPTIDLVESDAYHAAVEDVRTRIIEFGKQESELAMLIPDKLDRDHELAMWLSDMILDNHPRICRAMKLVDDYALRHPATYPNFGDKGKGVFEWLGYRIPADSEGADDVDWADIKAAEGEARPEVQTAIKRLLSYSPKTVANNG